MRRLALALIVLATAAPASAAAAPRVLAVHFDAAVNPATQGYLDHQLDRASGGGYDAVVLLLDTPGGLADSMRKIVRAERSSRVPVVAYVAPKGGRAAAADVRIGRAADLLAIAPTTTVDPGGEATPALTAGQALGRHAVDLVAPTVPALLRQADGRTTVRRGLVLHTAGAAVTEASPGFLTRLLSTLLDPNVVSLLLLAGLAGIGFEILHPGALLPGVLGAVALAASLYGLAVLPTAWAAAPLVLLGIALIVVDLHVVSHGALTLAGIAGLAVGLVLLFHDAPAPYRLSTGFAIALTAAIGESWALALSRLRSVLHQPALVGVDEVVGEIGHVRNGLVHVHGELWRARSAEPLDEGVAVEVERVEDGLVLGVRRTDRRSLPPAG